jgi:putative holliday junction resolvase
VRVLGIDLGRRRIGLAISDVSGTLARPLDTLSIAHSATLEQAIDRVSAAVLALVAEEDGLAAIVVGLPRGLDGSTSDETRRALAFIDGLRRRTSLPIVEGDERLTSREAESRLALRERNWQKRKRKLDAAAAAIILQDYLDRRGCV